MIPISTPAGEQRNNIPSRSLIIKVLPRLGRARQQQQQQQQQPQKKAGVEKKAAVERIRRPIDLIKNRKKRMKNEMKNK